MELIADILLVAGALGAGLYCFVLSRRLKRFTDLEKGVGGAVAVLSTQADELKKSLGAAREASDQSGEVLKELTQRAESVAQRLELMLASMHDIVPPEDKPAEPEPVNRPKGTSAKPQVEADAEAAETGSEHTTKSSEKSAESEDNVEVAEKPEQPEDSTEATEKPTEVNNETPTAGPAKRPDGLMFFRHTRSQGEAAI